MPDARISYLVVCALWSRKAEFRTKNSGYRTTVPLLSVQRHLCDMAFRRILGSPYGRGAARQRKEQDSPGFYLAPRPHAIRGILQEVL